MLSVFNFYFWRLSLLFPWNDNANWIVRYPGPNKPGSSRQGTSPSKGHMGVKMSSLGKILYFFKDVCYLNFYFYLKLFKMPLISL